MLVEKKRGGDGFFLKEGVVFSTRQNVVQYTRRFNKRTRKFCCIVGWPTEKEAKAFAISLPFLPPPESLNAFVHQMRLKAQQAQCDANAVPAFHSNRFAS